MEVCGKDCRESSTGVTACRCPDPSLQTAESEEILHKKTVDWKFSMEVKGHR